MVNLCINRLDVVVAQFHMGLFKPGKV